MESEAGLPAGAPPSGDGGRRRGWLGVVLIAALVGCGIGAGVGAGVAATIHSQSATVVNFSPNTSVFRRMRNIQAVLAKVLPSVVAIQASGPGCATGQLGGTQLDEGTGMILTSAGEILTNNHVIANATQIEVTLYGQAKTYPATLIGTDPTFDVALLQVHGAAPLPTVVLGRSSKIQVGDDVLAIGNALALSESTPSVTEGIISAEGRSIAAAGADCAGDESLDGLLQTQAAINPGNSGGPLVDGAGQVIGMNTAAATSSAGNAPAQNIGFAIPIDSVRTLLPGEGVPRRRGGVGDAGRALRLWAYADDWRTGGERRVRRSGCKSGNPVRRRDRQVRRPCDHHRCLSHRGRSSGASGRKSEG